METPIKLGILAVAGYLGYQYFYGSSVATPVSTSAPVLPVPVTSATPAPTVTQNGTLLNIIQTLSAARLVTVAGVPSNQLYSFWQWNFILNTMLSGYAPPAPEDLGVNGATNIDAPTYYGLILTWAKKQAGVSGLRGFQYV